MNSLLPKTAPREAVRTVRYTAPVRCSVMAALLTCLAFATLSVRAETLDIIRNGQTSHLLHPEEGGTFPNADGPVELRGNWKGQGAKERQIFAVDATLGPNFTLKARMRLENADTSATTIEFDNTEQFGFGGVSRKMWFRSERIKGVKLDRPAPQAVLDGAMFDLEIARTADSFTLRIDGEPIVEATGPIPEMRTINLRPWRGVMRIESMTLSGDVTEGRPSDAPIGFRFPQQQ
jgi:hypothetical protein